MQAAGGAVVQAWGDQALMVRFGARVDPDLNARAQALAARVRAAAPPWLVDCVPSYASVLIVFDVVGTEPAVVETFVRALVAAEPAAPRASSDRLVAVPVWYAPALAPDLADVAAACGLSVDEVIRRHAAQEYRVYTLGFRPGFAFMGSVDESIAVPRLATPRARVEAGAVGIAGRQTGIYPSAGPGGWRLIGRTPWRLFDPTAAQPFLLRAGDRVRFVPIDAEEFQRSREGSDDVD